MDMNLRRIEMNKGFTLIELMIVIAIIVIISCIAIPQMERSRDMAKAEADLKTKGIVQLQFFPDGARVTMVMNHNYHGIVVRHATNVDTITPLPHHVIVISIRNGNRVVDMLEDAELEYEMER